jgi:pseudouridine synthase
VVRLHKLIAQTGLASRRAAESLIRQGRVSVNGEIVTEMGLQVDPGRDRVLVDARPLDLSVRLVYVLLHKPGGCVTTLSDPQGRKTVMSYLAGLDERVFPVGRLDYDAEGLLLLTNDGALAHRLQHPRFGVEKTYQVKVQGHPSGATLARLRAGIELEEGTTAPARVSVVRVLRNSTWLRLVIHQGWYRQIKRMGEQVGHPVLKIRRTGYGPLRIGDLRPGSWRPLERQEIRHLRRMVRLDPNEPKT